MKLSDIISALVETGASPEILLAMVEAWEREHPEPTGRLGSTRAGALRRRVLERDGETCAYCGGASGPFEVDHVVPLVKGGGNSLDNLAIACRPCNRSKGGRSVEEWGGRKWR